MVVVLCLLLRKNWVGKKWGWNVRFQVLKEVYCNASAGNRRSGLEQAFLLGKVR